MENIDNKMLTKTFLWMFLGLLGTAIIAIYTYTTGLYEKIYLDNGLAIVAIAEVAVVLIFSFTFRKMSPTVAGIFYFLYAFINGITFSWIFAAYELNSIILVFVACAALYGTLALIGWKTNVDLSRWSTILFTTLFIGIILSIVNLFLHNPMLDIGLDWLILIDFLGITIYDMSKLKLLAQDPDIQSDKLYIYGAFQFYLDFINIFIRLLRLFAKARD